jgi:hypothetical protein
LESEHDDGKAGNEGSGTMAVVRVRLILLASCSKEPFTTDPDVDIPAPRQHSFSHFNSTYVPGIKALLRLEHPACPLSSATCSPCTARSSEKLGWQEKPDGATAAADCVQLAFA